MENDQTLIIDSLKQAIVSAFFNGYSYRDQYSGMEIKIMPPASKVVDEIMRSEQILSVINELVKTFQPKVSEYIDYTDKSLKDKIEKEAEKMVKNALNVNSWGTSFFEDLESSIKTKIKEKANEILTQSLSDNKKLKQIIEERVGQTLNEKDYTLSVHVTVNSDINK